MKNFITSMIVTLVLGCCSLFAQDTQSPSVCGISMDENAGTFKTELRRKGWTLEDDSIMNVAHIVTFSGTFLGKDAYFLARYQNDRSKFSKITLFHKASSNSWSDIEIEYNRYKKLYSDKYGQPSNDFHFFRSPYYEGDGYELQALKNEKCIYSTYWEVGDFIINIQIQSSAGGGAYVSFGYENVLEQARLNDLRDQAISDEI